MPTISFANPKGGAGKTTAALLFATQTARLGSNVRVSIIDADPERWITHWSQLPASKGLIKSIVSDVSEDTIIDAIQREADDHEFVIVDLEGTANLSTASAISMSDFVVIPVQGSAMDAVGAGKTARMIKNQEKALRRSIPYCAVLTRTNAAIATRESVFVRSELEDASIPTAEIEIVERSAYRALFSFGGDLCTLDRKQVNGVDKAISNASKYVRDILTRMHNYSVEREVVA